MTTTDPQPQSGETIPPWFMAFAEENARQHAELAQKIADVHAELTQKIANVHADLLEKIGDVRVESAEKFGELKAEIAENKVAIAETRAEMHQEFARMLRWVVGTIGGMGLAVIGTLIYVTERLA